MSVAGRNEPRLKNMLRLDDAVTIVGRPVNNNDWDIPTCLVGQLATVIAVRVNDCIRVRLVEGGQTWNFPYDCRGVLELVNKNKWNTLGYVSPFKPLNLP